MLQKAEIQDRIALIREINHFQVVLKQLLEETEVRSGKVLSAVISLAPLVAGPPIHPSKRPVRCRPAAETMFGNCFPVLYFRHRRFIQEERLAAAAALTDQQTSWHRR